MDKQNSDERMQLTSPAFKDNDNIPVQYTCKGENVSPPLNIFNVPKGAKSLALIMHDPDAPTEDFVHWLIWDMQPGTHSVRANSTPVGAMQGATSFGNNEYGGPCPPAGSGTHRYIFELYALDCSLNLSSTTTREKLQKTMKGHILEKATLIGLISADN
jgi:Raf kinase inhibitor-like YbhB/YbcL family protein